MLHVGMWPWGLTSLMVGDNIRLNDKNILDCEVDL